MSAALPEGKSAVPSSLLAACVLGLLVCPFVYLAIAIYLTIAVSAYDPELFAVTVPPLLASSYYLGRRYLRKAANEPMRIRSVLFEIASWPVIGGFLLIISNVNLMTPIERFGTFCVIHLLSSAVLVPLTVFRRTALKERLARLPPWMAVTVLVVFVGLEAITVAVYMTRAPNFPH